MHWVIIRQREQLRLQTTVLVLFVIFKHPSDVNSQIVLHRLAFWLKEALGTNMQRKKTAPSVVTSHTNKISLKDHHSSWRFSQWENHKCYGKSELPQNQSEKLTQITDDAEFQSKYVLALMNDAHVFVCDCRSGCHHSLPACWACQFSDRRRCS